MGLLVAASVVGLLSHCSGKSGTEETSGGGGVPPISSAACDIVSVSAAIATASPGTVVVVPAGTCRWSRPLTIDKGLILLGAGIGKTVIINESGQQFGPALISYAPFQDESFEISGFTLDGQGANGLNGPLLEIDSSNSGTALTKIKVHDNLFKNANSRAISMSGLEFGVFYKNQFLDNYIGIGITGAGVAGWQFPQTLGGPNYPYFEDNTFKQTIARGGFISETGIGGRLVFRHNSIIGYGGNQGEVWDQHGNQGDRGSVAGEIYNNTVNLAVDSRVFNHRGGQAIFFNNTITGANGSFNITEYSCWKAGECTLGLAYPILDQITKSYYWNNRTVGSVLLPSYCCSRADCSCGGNSACGQFDDDFIQRNRDYWLPTIELDAAKPQNCNVGDKFGATDTGRLYSCDAPNLWTLQYQPYQYPHPLR